MENVHPREIEEFLYTHPGILNAQVNGVPVPDEVYGEELKTRPAQAPRWYAPVRQRLKRRRNRRAGKR